MTRQNWVALRPAKFSSAGFGLVELMVSMVIGLLGIIVMMQMFTVFEEQKRTTIGGDDALTSGAIALNGLQRDIERAGWGLNSIKILGCSITGLVPSATVPLAPVVINPVGLSAIDGFADADTDTLMVMAGNANNTVEGVLINAVAGSIYSVKSSQPFAVGDNVFAMPKNRPINPSPCVTLVNVKLSVAPPSLQKVQVPGSALATVDQGLLFNLGPAPSVLVYAIRNSNLSVCDYIASDCTGNAGWEDIANNVISMRAQFGRDTTDVPTPPLTSRMDGVIDQWDQYNPVLSTSVAVSSTAAKDGYDCRVARIRVVRIALVARSSQPEKVTTPPVTAVAPGWMGSAVSAVTPTNPTAVPITPPASGSGQSWQNFRYKTFQTIVPLRNITVMGPAPEC